MSLVTVIGAASQTYAVTVEGARAYDLSRQYSDAVTNGWNNPSNSSKAASNVGVPDSKTPPVVPSPAPSGWASVKGAAQNFVIDSNARTVTLKPNNDYTNMTISGVPSATVNDESGWALGHDSITFNTNDGTVTGGWCDTISAAGDLTVIGTKSAHISVDGSLTFIGGTPRGEARPVSQGGVVDGGYNTITAGNATIYGASKGFYYVDVTTKGGTTYLEQYQGATNVSFDASKSHQALDAWVGNKDTIRGTSLDDVFHFGVPSDSLGGGTTVDKNWQSTVYGGSGNNIFDFVSTGGGSYTIGDFNQSAGNKVELHNVTKSALDKDVQNSKGSSTLKLDDGTQITFSGMTIGTNITDNNFELK